MPLKLAALFCNNMVVQQGIPLPVWGWADAGEEIAVTLAGQSAAGVAGPDGRWQIKLPALAAGGPYELSVSGRSALTVRNVMVGEVWIASGQSNMEFTVAFARDAATEIEAARYPGLRMFTVAKTAVVDPPSDVAGAWTVCAPETVAGFSAVAYFFARELHRRLGVPVGILHTSWGGTPAEAWTSRAAMLAEPSLQDIVLKYEKGLATFARDNAAYEAKLKDEYKHYPADPGNNGHPQGWATPAASLDGWGAMKVPCMWQGAGLDFNGVVWFRRDVDVPEAWAGKDLTLSLCPCDKQDMTYFNNVQVGAMGTENPNAWCTPRSYRVPAALVQAGPNTIAVRIFSNVYAGGFMGSPADMRLAPSADEDQSRAIRLDGEWRYKVEHNFGKVTPLALTRPLGPGNGNSPCALFNGMLAPLAPYGLRGAIWYQGESNADRAAQYRVLFPTLIKSWRQTWDLGDFPFLFVQLANYLASLEQPADSAWAELREAQTMALKLPQTGMAVAIDIGDALDIHPKNKQDVGLRLAYSALHGVYQRQDIVPSGPLFRSAHVEGGHIRLAFDHVDGGLVAKGHSLAGFAVAGQDRQFVWAEARIDGETVLVGSPQVPRPVAVRYGWANNPPSTLYNKIGLPASPFRTDDWPRA